MQNPLEITPVEFEIFVRRILERQGKALEEFRTEHLERLSGSDGDYIFDVTARFEALGADFLVLIECKRYTSDPVERAEVQALNQKKLSVGAHKAMVFTTSTYRKGAIDFAKAHGIALVRVEETGLTYAVRALLDRLAPHYVLPATKSLSEFLFGSKAEEGSEGVSDSKDAQIQAFKIGVLRQHLDYLRIISSRGYEVDDAEIANLEEEILEERAKLESMRE